MFVSSGDVDMGGGSPSPDRVIGAVLAAVQQMEAPVGIPEEGMAHRGVDRAPDV